jgi:hypothetical protein
MLYHPDLKSLRFGTQDHSVFTLCRIQILTLTIG